MPATTAGDCVGVIGVAIKLTSVDVLVPCGARVRGNGVIDDTPLMPARVAVLRALPNHPLKKPSELFEGA